jgi:ABC-type bacteriocin/lantibiotic exporter with double-glycine peptidase domain
MRLVRQRTDTDCGVACLAMLAGIPWAQARHALFDRAPTKSFATNTQQMRAALLEFGIVTSLRLFTCKNPLQLKRDALLRTNVKTNGDSHWAVWDFKRQRVLDPYYKRTRPCSALLVLRRQTPKKVHPQTLEVKM